LINAKGLPGKREDAYRAGMIPKIFNLINLPTKLSLIPEFKLMKKYSFKPIPPFKLHCIELLMFDFDLNEIEGKNNNPLAVS